MARLIPLWFLALGLATACGAPPKPRPRPTPRRVTPPPAPRVRVGGFLRLARAGVLQWQRGPKGQVGLLARVPAAQGAAGWQRAIDTQGNLFRVAPGGRIVPDGEPRAGRQPASVANVAYYYAQSIALMAARYRRQGLVMAAEILDLPGGDPSVKRAHKALCVLLHRLGIKGDKRAKLYRHIVAVSHRRGARVQVRNHVHGFGLTAPLSWKLLAGSLPKLGPRATVLVLALPADGGGPGARANLLWTTQQAPSKGTLAQWAAKRWLTTPGAKRLAQTPLLPPGVHQGQGVAIGPVTYRGRRLHTLQWVFAEGGRLHHLVLLHPAAADAPALRRAVTPLIKSFVPSSRKHPCDS